jgi:hypothetical protein
MCGVPLLQHEYQDPHFLKKILVHKGDAWGVYCDGESVNNLFTFRIDVRVYSSQYILTTTLE